ncbi:hypothetical protein VZT92_023001 [Zoarces viviparus]|uniref:Uncharacterized protein n=1 Tax=Zoarces viviparus TaxID=48416 RepID=A0AAW1E660_ZOAVI
MKPTGTSIPGLLEGSPEGAVGVHQPKFVCLGHPSTTAQYIIIAKNDKVAIPLQDEGGKRSKVVELIAKLQAVL